MKIRNYYLKKERATGDIWSDLSGVYKKETSVYAERLYSAGLMRNDSLEKTLKIDKLIGLYFKDTRSTENSNDSSETELIEIKQLSKKVIALSVSTKLINFFTEFEFEPNFRFVNTLAHFANSYDDSVQYISNYFSLSNNSYKYDVLEKMKSKEFINMMSAMSQLSVTNRINSRLEIFYGAQGTGKTTEAIKLAESIMVCHSAMLPQDLMEDFAFEDGKATFNPSALQIAMVEGYTLALDEINLLPFESLRFMQSILDNKKEFEYKGSTIKIHPDFKVIGTMNLIVNGSIYSLPEPLIDRASNLVEYKLTAESLMTALY